MQHNQSPDAPTTTQTRRHKDTKSQNKLGSYFQSYVLNLSRAACCILIIGTFFSLARRLQSSYSGRALITRSPIFPSFTLTFPYSVSTSTISRESFFLSASYILTPRVVVSARMQSHTSWRWGESTSAVSITAGRLFFINIGVREMSSAPFSRSFSIRRSYT